MLTKNKVTAQVERKKLAMCDVKGKHNLIIWGWTKSGAHIHSNTTVFTVFFQVEMALI